VFVIRFLKALILLPVAILIVLLAVANRAPVTLSLDPFSQEAPEFAFQLPLFAVIFAAGGTATWLAQGKNRKSRRKLRRETRQLRYETERLKAQTPSNTNLPATVPAQARSI
jgi:uncharacterized integral membrane protein